jgi:protein SCO1/2
MGASAGLFLWAHEKLKTPLVGGDFTLHSVHGPVALHDLAGKGVVLYFGYTSCPDVCPLSLSKLSHTVAGLTEAQRRNFAFLFVSVDYRKDTPEKAQTYVSYFFKGSPAAQAEGLTGTKGEIDQVTALYKTSYVIEDDPKSALGYTVEHPTDFYFIDKKGRFSSALPTDAPDAELKKGLEEIL